MPASGYKLFATGDVLTAAQVNDYLMLQTVMVFANSAARTSALSSVLAEGLVSYLKDTDVVEIYTGAAWVSLDDPNAIQNSIVDAKGDLITATADNTPARLAVGTNGQTLVANSSTSTGLEWQTPASGGGMTLLSTTSTVTGSAYTISSLATTYNALYLIWEGLSCTAASSITIGFAGGTGTGGGVNQSATALGLSGATNWKIVNDTQASGNCAQMWIYNYAASSAKPLQSVSGGVQAGYRGSGYMGFTDYASAITTFTVTLSAGTFSAGTLKVYGVK